MSVFSDELQKLRKQNNMTQEELADKLGVTKSAISMYENGKRFPDYDTLERIANLLNVNISLFFSQNKKASFNIEDAYEKEILEVFRSLTPAKRKKVIAQLRLELEEQNSES